MNWIFTELWEALKPYLGNIINRIKLKVKIKRISRELELLILSEFQGEIYFNEFDKFLFNSKILSSFIQNCVSASSPDYENIVSFVNERIERFIFDNPQFIVYKNSMKTMLTKLFQLTFNKLNEINDIELNSVVNILKENCSQLEKSIVKVDEKIDHLSQKADDTTKKLQDLIDNNVGQDILSNVKLITSVTTAAFVVPEIDEKMLCKRENSINSIIDLSNNVDWLHITGSAWSGKTITAILLKKYINNSFWIDFSHGDPVNIIKSFNYIVENIKFSDSNNITIIVDNLPDLYVSSLFSYAFADSVNSLKIRKCKIISFGIHEINKTFLDKISMKYESIVIPEFQKNDVVELMQLFQAPKTLIADKTSNFFLELTGKKPAALVIILQYLKSNKWNIDSERFTNILTLNVEELNHEINSVVKSTIKDEKTRELLYRISFVGHSITRKELESIANIEPSINMIGERLESLKGIWISGNSNISTTGILRNLSNDNLNDAIKINIYDTIANSILSKHTLDQLDVSRLICHLVGAKRINEAGQVYVSAMKNLYENEIDYNDSFIFVDMWSGIPLPVEMDDRLKAVIRLSQILYNVRRKKTSTYAECDLIELSKKNDTIRELMVAGGTILLNKNHQTAMTLINAANVQGLPNVFQLTEYLEEGAIESITTIMFYELNSLSDMESWLTFVKTNVTDSMIKKMETSQFSDIFKHGFEKVRLSISDTDINELISIINDIYEYALSNSWYHLMAGCIITLLRIESINKNGYENSKLMSDSYLQNTSNEILLANINYQIGLLGVDNKDYSFAIKSLCKSSSFTSGLDVLEKIMCCVNCYICFANTSMMPEAESAINQALTMISTNSDIDEIVRRDILIKIHFERIIFYYLYNNFSNCVDSLEYINNYFKNNAIEGNEHYIAIASHCLMYMHADLLKNKPPKHLGDEEYVAPYVGFMWNQENSEAFKQLNIEIKMVSVLVLSAQLFDHYEEYEKSLELSVYSAKKILTQNKDSIIYLFLNHNGFIIYKLFQYKKYDLATSLLQGVLEYCSTISLGETLINNVILQFSIFFAENIRILPECVESFKGCTPSEAIATKWDAWVDIIEKLIGDQDTITWLTRGNEFHILNDYCTHAVCYIFAALNADFKQVLNIYLIILSGYNNFIFGDTYWLNKVLIPNIKRNILQAGLSYGIHRDTLENYLQILDDYMFDQQKLKMFFSKCINLISNHNLAPECIRWLNT